MLLQEVPVNTFNYMLLGFSAILGIMALFLISLVVRFRNLYRDLEQLEGNDVNERTYTTGF
ncbi:MAG: hypothetical protein KAS19_06965 [Anaerolineales bacterium]|nr:hypothetical protein [Anaerolineales bacterium]